MTGIAQCSDFMMFMKALKQQRDIDDKIVYALNLSTPTASIQARGVSPQESCTNLKADLEKNYANREESLRRCINIIGDEITQLKSEGMPANSKQLTLRMLRNELNVEEIIRDRTTGIFNAKCKEFL